MPNLKVTAPIRIDISAGWPDSDPYRKDFGGNVLNAAINIPVTCTNFKTDKGTAESFSGLGSSGAVRTCYLVASNPQLLEDKPELIRRVWIFENRAIGHRAGLQDQAAAIYGGVNLWQFGSGEGEKVPIRRTKISKSDSQHLYERLLLISVGRSSISPNIHDLVFGQGNYERNIPVLDRMSQIANQMHERLTDESSMIGLINETWKLQKSLHESIENPNTQVLERALSKNFAGKYALRETGSGGCALVYASPEIRREILSFLPQAGLPKEIKVIPFKFDYEGIKFE